MFKNAKRTAVNATTGLMAAFMGVGLLVAVAGSAHADTHSVKPVKKGDLYQLSLTAIPVTGMAPVDAMKLAGFTNVVTEPDGVIRATEGSGANAPKALANIILSPEGIVGDDELAVMNSSLVPFSNMKTRGYLAGISNACTKNEALEAGSLTDGVQAMASLNNTHAVGLQLETSSGRLDETSVSCPHGKTDTFQVPTISLRKDAFHLDVIHGAHNSVTLPGFWPLNGTANVIVVTLTPVHL